MIFLDSMYDELEKISFAEAAMGAMARSGRRPMRIDNFVNKMNQLHKLGMNVSPLVAGGSLLGAGILGHIAAKKALQAKDDYLIGRSIRQQQQQQQG